MSLSLWMRARDGCVLIPPLQNYDDWIREWNSESSTKSGSIDSCGWPKDPNGLGFDRRTSCFHEDFTNGFNDSKLHILLAKSCCSQVPALRMLTLCCGAAR